MKIIKSTGTEEVFEEQKLARSLARARIPPSFIKDACASVVQSIEPGMTTERIAHKVMECLIESYPQGAGRYSLKRGIMALGPAGFIFERYLEAILKALGYETKRDQIMAGVCVSHEVDVVAWNDTEHFLIEAKYRNDTGGTTDVEVAMYAQARLEDIVPNLSEGKNGHAEHRMWLITNARFTSSAIRYGTCKGIRMTGWGYPHGEGIEDIITRHSVYPVTVLPSVDHYAREQFAQNGLLLAYDLIREHPKDLSSKFGLKQSQAEKIVKEAQMLIAPSVPNLPDEAVYN